MKSPSTLELAAETDGIVSSPGIHLSPTMASDGLGVAEISARLDRLPATRTIWKMVLMLSLGYFFEIYDLMYTGYIAPGLVKQGILTTATHGLFGTTGVASFIAALFCGLFVGTIACGFLADKYGRRAIFTYALLGYVASNAIMAFQTTAVGLNTWRFLAGIGLGVELVTIGAYMSEIVPKHIRGRAFAVGQAIGFSAVPIVAFISFVLVPRTLLGLEGWRWVVLLGAHGGILIWWVRLHLPESPRWLAQKGRIEEANAILGNIEQKVSQEYRAPLPNPVASDTIAHKASFSDMWRPPYRRRTLMMMVFHIFQTVGYYGFASWVPTLLMKQGVTVTHSLLYSSLIAIAAPIGPLLGLLIADKFERKTVIVALSAANVVCGLLFSQLRDPALLIMMGVCLTLAGNMISFTYHAYQTELFPTSIRVRAVGFVYSWSRLSAIFSAFFIARILNQFGVVGVFTFIAGAMVVVMVSIGVFGPRTKNVGLDDLSQ
ncbi:MFS transporter [Pandoraea terrigena]|uniref:Inner membrane metabolite transport protein YdjE n=1 Tax=Pandoraea terrigena TaxID=2508292 RepID=A0A5E4XWE3_9BURK|nr:MFS transporter [Pandoraea terrigena]VVE40650.1 Inner membrane metabolite transport protein YdjE [Pandoraea terrigena]